MIFNEIMQRFNAYVVFWVELKNTWEPKLKIISKLYY